MPGLSHNDEAAEVNVMQKMSSGIWQVSGSRPGPHLVILGGVHGDEKTGIEVVKELYAMFQERKEKLCVGTLTLILGNEEAIKINKRGTSPEYNLNRMFTEHHLSGPVLDFYESRRAHELASILQSVDISIDIHSTSVPGRPFLPCAFTARHEKIYRWFDADLVLTDPDFILGGERATTDEYVDSCGGTGICFETGFAGDTSRLPVVLESILNILADKKMVSPSRSRTPPKPGYKVYRLTRKILLTDEGFHYAGTFPEPFHEVKKGEIIGYHGKRAERAEQEGVIAFPKAPEQWHVGHDLFFLARRIR
jgi:succinylglutamate desuccinylase